GAELTQSQLERIILLLQPLGALLDREGIQLVAQDLKREIKNRPKRLKSLPTEEARQQVLQNVERDRNLFESNQEQFELLDQVLVELLQLLKTTQLPLVDPDEPELLDPIRYRSLIEQTKQDQVPTLSEALDILIAVREEYLQILQGLKVIQAGSR